MNRNVRRLASVLLILLCVVLLLAACQRERPAPEPDASQTQPPPTQADETPQPPTEDTTPAQPSARVTTVSVEGEGGAQDVTPPEGATALPGDAPTSAPPDGGQGALPLTGPTFDYVVQSSDTLFSIAQRYNTDVDTLRRLNNLPDDIIQVGQMLQVPGAGQTGQQPVQPGATPGAIPTVEPIIYTVGLGDTLSSIAAQFGIDWQRIATVNAIANPNAIYVGQQLVIPDVVPTPTPTVTVKIHVVQAGDTLYSIAVRYGVTLQALAQRNQITNLDQIYPGQELVIPE